MAGKTSLKKRILSSGFVHFVGTLIFSTLMRLIFITARVRYEFPETSLPYVHGRKPAIFCFWHGRMIMQPFLKPLRPMHVLISHHNDGALITRTMQWFGIDSVRIARKRGSTGAMRELFAVTERGDNIAITPDGPRGPFQKAADGAAYVAMKTGYPIIPITFSAARHWRFNSWDKFMIPKFFTRIRFVAADPVTVAPESSEEILAQATQALETQLIDITAQADVECGVAPLADHFTVQMSRAQAVKFGRARVPAWRVFYNVLGVLLSPLLYLWLMLRVARGKEKLLRLHERFGSSGEARPEGTLLWLHAASVGEVQSVLTLARGLLDQQPQAHLLITSGTVTSANLLASQALPRTVHQFTPMDTYLSVRRFLNHWKPDLVLWVESEFWPQLLWQVRGRHIPALLINARLSENSARGWRHWPRTIRSILATFEAIYAGSDVDALRLKSLGASDVREVGNLKYDAQPLPFDEEAFLALRQLISQRRCWIAASTHANEEERIAAIHKELVQQFPDVLTIIAPRHAKRGDAIAATIRAAGVQVVQRSKQEVPTAETGIYIADTMGELGLFYRLSGIVFVGGSLIAHGGHNPLEAARLNCATIVGPHYFNFTAIVDHLLSHQAMVVVQNDIELQLAVAQLLRSQVQRDELAVRARTVVYAARGASAAILRHIERLLGRV